MNFWLENKIDKLYQLSIDEIKKKYIEFLKTKDISWIEYYGHNTVFAFVSEESGLNSVTESCNFETLQNELIETRHEYLKNLSV